MSNRYLRRGGGDFTLRKQTVPFINKLYQAGHCTFPGAFVQSVIFCGKYAAELMLKNE
jgi:hypothetical protein